LEKTENTIVGESGDSCETDEDVNSRDSLKTVEGQTRVKVVDV
jgi:hypothetical protein